jgi:hypothetical protein
MISFTRYITEVIVPKKSETMGISRSVMPQIKHKHMKDFLEYLKDNGIKVKKVTLDPGKLKAIQGEFDKEKIAKNIEKLKVSGEKQKPIFVSDDGYVIDGNHRWLAALNAGVSIDAFQANKKGKKVLDVTNRYSKVQRKELGEEIDICSLLEQLLEKEDSCPVITKDHMKAFEKFVDRMFEKFGVDFDFTKHFRERMSDTRNDPCISMKELADLIKKIYEEKKRGKNTLSKYKDSEVVIKDMQSDLNMPVAIEYDPKKDELEVIAKTVMRKKNFRTPNPVVRV